MSWWLGLITGIVLGFIWALVLLPMGGWGTTESLGKCRSENPGYDCSIGWVRGEAFK